MVVRRQHLTLMEMLLTIGLIAIAAGIISYGVMRSYSIERFCQGVGCVVNKAQQAQEIMLVHGIDVFLQLDPAEKGVVACITTDEQLPADEDSQFSWMTALNRKIEINGIFLVPHTESTVIEFMSCGSKMTKKTIAFSSSPEENGHALYIHFPGYPTKITSSKQSIPDEI